MGSFCSKNHFFDDSTGSGGRRRQAQAAGSGTTDTPTGTGTTGTPGGVPPRGVGVVKIDPQFTSTENKSGPKRLLDCVMCCLFCLRVSKRGVGEWKRGLVKRNRVARAHVELKERGDPDALCDAEIDEYLSWQPLIRLATQVLKDND